MPIDVIATYENGVLKLDQPLPLEEHQRVHVTVSEQSGIVERTYGILGFTGDPAILRKIAEDAVFSVEESREL